VNIVEWIESCERAHADAKREGRTEDAKALHVLWHQALLKYDEADPLDFIPVQDGMRESI